jgi:hypothetical protein
MNGLAGFALQDILIGSDLSSMNGSVYIPNPSVITVPMVCGSCLFFFDPGITCTNVRRAT